MQDYKRAVVVDGHGNSADGEVVEGVENISAARRRGVLVLPYEGSLADEPCSGYFRRGLGWPGHRFDKGAGESGAPMLLYARPGLPWIYWCALLASGGTAPSGRIRLVTSTARQTAFSGGVSALSDAEVRVEDLCLNEHPAGVSIGGRLRCNVVCEGYLSLSLWAVARQVSVSVAAVTQCEGEYRYP